MSVWLGIGGLAAAGVAWEKTRRPPTLFDLRDKLRPKASDTAPTESFHTLEFTVSDCNETAVIAGGIGAGMLAGCSFEEASEVSEKFYCGEVAKKGGTVGAAACVGAKAINKGGKVVKSVVDTVKGWF